MFLWERSNKLNKLIEYSLDDKDKEFKLMKVKTNEDYNDSYKNKIAYYKFKNFYNLTFSSIYL
jgi:hypothetical protein